jgi:uncharacterized protein (DUF488 family)
MHTQCEIVEFSKKELIRYTYLKYPYFATKSQIAAELLSKNELFKVKEQKRQLDKLSFFTIGYEGISLENYLNKLIINDVHLLCDVRNNPLSRKFGFSKNQLRKACESIGIKYHHIPDLGIESGKRNALRSINDYNRLFDEYEQTTLIENQEQLLDLQELVRKYRRVSCGLVARQTQGRGSAFGEPPPCA